VGRLTLKDPHVFLFLLEIILTTCPIPNHMLFMSNACRQPHLHATGAGRLTMKDRVGFVSFPQFVQYSTPAHVQCMKANCPCLIWGRQTSPERPTYLCFPLLRQFGLPQILSPSPSLKLCATILHDGNLPGPDVVQADDRRLAELHYKMCLTLQYLDQPEDSLKEIKVGNFLALTLTVPNPRYFVVACVQSSQ